MKEATGEASMTGITIGIIAIISAIAIPMIRGLVQGMENRSCCAAVGGEYSGGECYRDAAHSETIDNWEEDCKAEAE